MNSGYQQKYTIRLHIIPLRKNKTSYMMIQEEDKMNQYATAE